LSEHGLAAADVAWVVCDVAPGVAANLAFAQPETVQEAQFSMNFAIASAIIFGDVGLPHLDAAVLADPCLRNVMHRVKMLTGARWNEPDRLHRFPEGAFVTLLTRDGRTIEQFSGAARGTSTVPLDDAEIEAKFTDCAGSIIGPHQAETLLGRLHDVAALSSARDLLQQIDWSGADRHALAGAGL
ncbi:MAG: hypothetical protein ACREF1_16365, partial [Acetobacteraceae bacterium]